MCIICCGLTLIAIGQTPRAGKPLSNLRKKMISAKSDTIRLDTLSLIPNTVSIPAIAAETYSVDLVNAMLIWKQKPGVDSVLVQYRVFSSRLNAVTQHLVYDSVQNNFLAQPFVFNNNAGSGDPFFDFGTINYNGSFGRGISFGNNQDAVVTSNLNLQLNGFLADSIEIAAAITDNNIPIQPDGTTQQLNEFDRIFLQFKKKNWQLNLGDIDIRQNKSYFLNFYKRLQGASFETTNQLSPGVVNNTLVSGSIAKGKFTRNIFQGEEGNQGPYRLTGANNEFYFVVLANTERVYIDGELLQRGEDQDYVINYNTAEISFTPKRMITKDRRIQVEFEYADRNYLNANLYLSTQTTFGKKFKLSLHAFNNSDAKNSPINQTLDAPQKRFLDTLGNNINKAFYPIATLDTFSAGKILYRRVDTTYDAGANRDSAFVYSIDVDSVLYSLSFLDVGQGFGDYLPDFNGANGKVYRWIAPVGGVKQGRFAPATFLVTPKKQQVVSLGMDYNISKNTILQTEFGYSNYDVNTFSQRGEENNKGYAAKIILKNTKNLGGSAKLQLATDAGYEYVDPRFRPLERLRNIEFNRDWGLPYIVEPTTENIITGGVQLTDQKSNSLRYQVTNYLRGSSFTGWRNALIQQQSIKGWRFNNILSVSTTSSNTEKGKFYRPIINVSKQLTKFRDFTLGFGYTVEHNEVRNKVSDSVTAASFSFQTIQVSVKSSDKKPNRWGITYFTRTDKYPFGKELYRSDRSQNINLTGELTKNQKHQFRYNVTYRNLEILNKTITNQRADQSLLARGEYQVNEWQGLVTGNVLYEVGAGQEQRRDYAFLEVPAGRGEYTWIDYDNNGVQSLNEFEVAQFQDQAKYIRIFTPTNEFIKANYNTFNYSVMLNPRALINPSNAKGFSKFLTRINLQSSLQIYKKERAEGLVQLNPFKTPLNDTSLINLNSVFINTFSFNRFNTSWGFDVNNTRNSGKAILTYGLESRQFNEWSLRTRINFNKAIQLDLTGRKGLNELNTAKFDNRNFRIDQFSAEPRVSITSGTAFRISTGYKYSQKKNTDSIEKYSSHSVNTEMKYNILQSTSILAKFTYSTIQFSPLSNANSTVGYNMLDGLQPGKNFLWNLELTKRLSNNIEINIQYEGRKPGDARIIHVGRASLRALL
ncbi:MAG: hypothetical protein H7Y27_12685 [Gemmatimonadaceae bacterium]|nr:hypothetical protein [Chitinophagaceae bacterium]